MITGIFTWKFLISVSLTLLIIWDSRMVGIHLKEKNYEKTGLMIGFVLVLLIILLSRIAVPTINIYN